MDTSGIHKTGWINLSLAQDVLGLKVKNTASQPAFVQVRTLNILNSVRQFRVNNYAFLSSR